MKCLIEIDSNGNSINHPILINNFLLTYPDADLSGDIAPPGFVWFTRKNDDEQRYTKAENQVFETRYIKSADGINYEDEHYLRDMTEEELNELYLNRDSNKPFPSWNYNRELLRYEPPIPEPISHPSWNRWNWDEESLSWKETRIKDLITSNTTTSNTTTSNT
jgi:hypothetical protein